MGKSTLVLVALAALGLGSLIGVSLVDKEEEAAVDEAAIEASAPVIASTGGAPVYRFLGVDDVTIELDDFDRALPSTVGENYIARDAVLKTETITVELDTDEAVEYKAMMQQGDSIAFAWASDDAQVYYDFHAHDPSFGDDFWTRYEEGEAAKLSGSIVAPYNGQHGWYFLNLEGRPITITLEVAGFYDEVVKIDLEGY